MNAERLGKYELVRHLASGGMASVYLARLSGLGGFERHIVLKTLRTNGASPEEEALIPMFLDEARLVAKLHHQHIAQVYEVGRDASTYFLAMEYIHGETVRAVLETANKHGHILPLDFSMTVVCAAAAGLHHAHERCNSEGLPLGIVHRDVTPSNVIVSYDGSIKLIDFGIAKANDRATRTRSGFIKGKAGYMAPEQVKGHPVDRRSDVFALGVLAYELTTQSRAFQADSQFEQLERIANGFITPPSEIIKSYPVELEDVVMRALEVDPDDRYPDAHVMRSELERVSRELGLSLGEGSVMSVLQELYGPRPEPWLVAPGSIDYDITPSIVDVPFAIEVIDPGGCLFARSDAPVERDYTEPVDVEEAVEIVTPQPIGSTLTTRPRSQITPRVLLGVALVLACVGAAIVAIANAARDPEPPAPVAAPEVPVATKRSPKLPSPVAAPKHVKPAAPAAPVTGKPGHTGVPTPAPAVAVPLARKPAPAGTPAPALADPTPSTTPAADHVMLDVITDPPDASVVLDGVKLGTSPYHGAVSVKKVAWLKVRRFDRVPMRIKVSLESDVKWTVTLPPRR